MGQLKGIRNRPRKGEIIKRVTFYCFDCEKPFVKTYRKKYRVNGEMPKTNNQCPTCKGKNVSQNQPEYIPIDKTRM